MPRRVRIMWEGENGETFFVALDATVSETHSANNMITDHVVETGGNVADHVRPEPDTIALQGQISNTPIYLPATHTGGAQVQNVEIEDRRATPSVLGFEPVVSGPVIGSRTLPIGPQAKGVVLGFDPAFDRVGAVDQEFLRLRVRGTLLRVETTLRTYEQMAIQSYSVERSAAAGNSLDFSLNLKQVRFGATETVPAPTVPRKRKDKGQKQTKDDEAPSEESTESVSLLSNLFG